MNKILKFILVAVAMVTATASYAVTDKEMEQAKTIAAKHYLRYANNGSGYLDDVNPTSMSELNNALKAKEKENIKAFNAVAVPKDYASWDKDKLVEYWSSTFFKAPGLLENGKACAGVLKKKLQKLTVSAPTAASTEPASAPSEEKATEAEETAPKTDSEPATMQAEQSATADPALDIASDSLAAVADADAGLVDEQPKTASNTGWYIAILVVLVAVVVWLVVYAAKTMKVAPSVQASAEAEKKLHETTIEAKQENNRIREQYASSLAAKSTELNESKSAVARLEAQLKEADRTIESLKAQLAQAQAKIAQAETHRQESRHQPAVATPEPQKNPESRSASALPPVVYLGVVNSKGLFVKASRSINTESSVYRMDIPDGRNGSFMVANNQDVVNRILEDPQYWLGNGCIIENPEDAISADKIVTLAAGEAIFADNTCRVVKKAKVRLV